MRSVLTRTITPYWIRRRLHIVSCIVRVWCACVSNGEARGFQNFLEKFLRSKCSVRKTLKALCFRVLLMLYYSIGYLNRIAYKIINPRRRFYEQLTRKKVTAAVFGVCCIKFKCDMQWARWSLVLHLVFGFHLVLLLMKYFFSCLLNSIVNWQCHKGINHWLAADSPACIFHLPSDREVYCSMLACRGAR